MKNYGVLKGRAKKYFRDDDSSPHSELLMEANGTRYRIAINVRSTRGAERKRLVEYIIVDDLRSAIVNHARDLPTGWNDLRDGKNDEAAIDFIRSNLFRATDMKPLAHDVPGPDNDLFELVEDLFDRAINDPGGVVYAFGEAWGPEHGKRDQYFGFEPGNGVHLIHMNQGERGGDNAKYQDGALLFDLPSARTVKGLFIKFQNQSWHTDETNANPIEGAPVIPPIPISEEEPLHPWPVVSPQSPYHLARIVGALVNPRGDDPGGERVTILNTSDGALDLTGWSLLDAHDKADSLAGTIDVGEARTFRLTGRGAQLSNRGGTITLLNAAGLKVDGVAYTKEDAKREGRAITF